MKTINIILTHNYPGSITRLAAVYANQLVKKNYNVIVSYPMINHYRYHIFKIKNLNKIKRYFYLLKCIIISLIKFFILKKKKKWIGRNVHNVDSNVRENPYFLIPTLYNMPNADYIFLFQNHLLIDVIGLPKDKGEIIDSIHTSYFDDDETMIDWWNYVYDIVKRINVKRFVTSKKTYDYFLRKKIRIDDVIYHGVDLTEFSPSDFSKKDNSILMFSDPRKAKGYNIGIEILKKIKEKNKNIKFYSIGKVDNLDVSIFDGVYGFLTGKKYVDVYKKHKYFLFPSLYEGFPAPPLEAMASGAVCILSNVSGINEYAKDNINCALCEPGNIECFIKKIIKIITNPEICKKISDNAIKTANQYGWDVFGDKFINFIENKHE